MQQNPMPLKSFQAMAAHIRAEDARKAENLRRSASIARKAKGTGPRVAR